MEEVIIFGSGQVGTLFANILNLFPVKIVCFVDNNEEKWHTTKESVIIISPFELNTIDECPILIACMDTQSVKKQLVELGFQSRIMSLYAFVYEKIRFLDNNYMGKMRALGDEKRENWAVVIDNLSGTWGGAENWSQTLAESLLPYKKTYLVESMEQGQEKETVGLEAIRISINDNFYREHWALVEKLIPKMPFILVNNLSRDVLYAAIILKGLFPNKVKIITVLHSDFEGMYKMHTFWDDAIDMYHCVSSQIKRSLIDSYKVEADKVFFKESAMKLEDEFIKSYHMKQDEKVNISFACRLEKEAKRADLIPTLLEYLERKNIFYKLNIAGEGKCEEIIKKYIKENGLEKKVQLYGFVSKEQMPFFWKKQDIFVSLSEFEGTSLSMLEAMMYGVVPVVTRVSGVDDFVKNKENGLVYEVHDLQGIAEGINHLCVHRELLPIFGEECKRVVKEKCDKNEFLIYFLELLKRLEE